MMVNAFFLWCILSGVIVGWFGGKYFLPLLILLAIFNGWLGTLIS